MICDLEMESVSLPSQIKRKAYAVDCTAMPTYNAQTGARYTADPPASIPHDIPH